eukprot:1402302-Prymnesium_polylepis.1
MEQGFYDRSIIGGGDRIMLFAFSGHYPVTRQPTNQHPPTGRPSVTPVHRLVGTPPPPLPYAPRLGPPPLPSRLLARSARRPAAATSACPRVCLPPLLTGRPHRALPRLAGHEPQDADRDGGRRACLREEDHAARGALQYVVHARRRAAHLARQPGRSRLHAPLRDPAAQP